VASLGGYFKKLSLPPEELRALNLRRWVESLEGVTPIEKLEARQRAKAAGVIQNIRIDPTEGSGSIEATIIDGSGQVVTKWLGRSSLQGIRLGMGLIVEGVAGIGTDGDLQFLNPEYQLVPGPEHG
jgi:RecG wedge domain